MRIPGVSFRAMSADVDQGASLPHPLAQPTIQTIGARLLGPDYWGPTIAGATYWEGRLLVMLTTPGSGVPLMR